MAGTERHPNPGDAELAAYEDIVQHGYYTPPVLAFMLRRLAHPECLMNIGRRVRVYGILATLEKIRRNLEQARAYAEAGIKLTEDNRECGELGDAAVYLIDQLGSIAAMAGDLPQARSAFEREINLLRERERVSPGNGRFNLVGAYRGLAAVLGAQGDQEGARKAAAESLALAREAGNPEGEGLAALLAYEHTADQGHTLPDPRMLDAIPTEHLIGRVMALNIRAKALLAHGEREEGERVLHLAFREARRLQFGGELATAEVTAKRFGVTTLV